MEKKETKKKPAPKPIEVVRVREIHVGDVGAASCATICSAIRL